jgi:serine/threonine protein kinase
MGYIHIFHRRDVKLENLLLDGNNQVKLCDFGSITTTAHYPDQVSAGSSLDKMLYMDV